MGPIIDFFQQNTSLLVALGGVATILGLVFTIYQASHGKHIRLLKDENAQLRRQLANHGDEDPESVKQLIAELRGQLQDAKNRVVGLEAEVTSASERVATVEQGRILEREKAHQTSAALTTELEAAREQLAASGQADQARANLVKKALRLEGRVWERRARSAASPSSSRCTTGTAR